MASFSPDAAALMTGRPPASAPHARSPRVLIVEDDPVLTGLFREYLDGEEIDFSVAATVFEAEQRLRESDFDLLLLDISLPGEDGLSFYRRARQRLPRTLFMSAVDRLLHAGSDIPSDSWLPKPFGPEELSQRIWECLAPGRTRSAARALPDHGPASSDAGGAAGALAGETSARVLLVEDDPVLAEMISELLIWSGFQVTRASRISEAEAALEGNPAVVVMDGILPDGDGRDLIRKIRLRPSQAQLPVLMLSGRSSAADEAASREAGADDHLSKPFTEEELVARINTLLKLTSRARA
jgi:DNA-binding response OmpR family regulator